MKRGVSTFPFLLIFVIIAGSLILIFFFSFGSDILSTSEKVSKLSVIKNIDQQLAAFSLADNAISTINLGRKSEIISDCSNTQTTISFQEKTLKSQKLVLSPIKIQGKSIQAWTLSWNYPFKVTNFYYIIPVEDASKRVVFFYKEPSSFTPEAKKFIDDFKFPIHKVSDGINTASSDQKIIFQLHSDEPRPEVQRNTKIVKIDFNNPQENRKVKVCDESACYNDKKYLGNPLAIAAALSKTEQEYDCIEKQARNRLKDIVLLYTKKLELLLSKINRNECDTSSYNSISNYLTELDNIANNNPTDLKAAKNLEELNKDLRLTNCPQLYLQ